MKEKLVTYVSHCASRTGAPLLLRNALQHMNTAPWKSNMYLMEDGPLHEEFAQMLPVQVGSIMEKVTSRVFPGSLPDLYYLNSHSYAFLPRAKQQNIPVICHVHEIPLSFAQESAEINALFRTYPVRYFAVSEYVESMLVEHMGIASEKVCRVPTGIDTQQWQRTSDGLAMRDIFGIPAGATVIGMSGQIIPLKGVDLWLQMAAELVRTRPGDDLHFVWVGGVPPGGFVYEQLMRSDVQNLGLEGRVHFLGEHKDPKPLYEMFTVFVLPSRMESLSLVCLEHASLGTPTVAIRTAGGPAEFAQHGFTLLADEPRATSLASVVSEILDTPSLAASLSSCGPRAVAEHYDIRTTALRMQQYTAEVLGITTPQVAVG